VTKVVAAAFLVVFVAEAVTLAAPDRSSILVVSGGAVALALLALRWYLVRTARSAADTPPADEAAESLRRWLSRTESLVSRADAARTDWDRHLRPMLARQFEMATGQKRSKDRVAYDAAGRMLFGAELWPWVDPENVSPSGHDEPGPGRRALDEILQRLERV
jgi:hypothetical protein